MVAHKFEHFTRQLPSDVVANTKVHTHPAANLIVFKPNTFLDDEVELQDYHIILPNSTPPRMRIESREYEFKKGRLIAIPADTKVKCAYSAFTSQYTVMNINKGFFRGIAKEITGKSDISFYRINSPYSSRLLDHIIHFGEEIEYNKGACPLMIQSISIQIAIQILRETGSDAQSHNRSIPTDNDYIKKAIEYMYSYYSSNIRIEDICKQIHLSPYYFIRMFKDRTGQTPYEFLLSVRMEKAESMLKSGSYSIGEVAKLSGYINATHFSRTFKRVNGVPPSLYRKNYSTGKK